MIAYPALALDQALVASSGMQAIEARQPIPRITAAHSHHVGQLIGSLAGLLAVDCADGRWLVPSRHAAWIPSGQTHSFSSHGAYHGWSIYIAPEHCGLLPGRAGTFRITALLEHLILRSAQWSGAIDALAHQHIRTVILDELKILTEEPLQLTFPTDPRAASVAAKVLADLADNRTVDALCNDVGASARTITRLFVAETGLPFGEWRQRAKAFSAAARLADGNSVSAVASDLGYVNVSAFIDMFRRTMGTTPGRYQEQT